MRLFELFSFILSHTGAGVSGGGIAVLGYFLLFFAQIGFALAQALQFYFRTIPGCSIRQKLLSSIIPLILLVTAAIVEPLFFAMFTGGRFHEFDFLRGIFSDRQFYVEVLALFFLYGMAALLARWFAALRKAPPPRLGKLGRAFTLLEGVFIAVFGALCLLALVFDRAGAGIWGGLLLRSDTAMLWMVYGIYLILYKTVVRVFAVVWSALFIPRKVALDGREPEACGDRLMVKEIRQRYGLGCKIALQYSLITLYLFLATRQDGSVAGGIVYSALAVLICCCVWLAVQLAPWLFPRHTRRYKMFQALTDYEVSKFNKEYFGGEILIDNPSIALTRTFIVHKAPFIISTRGKLPQEEQERLLKLEREAEAVLP